MVQQYGTNMGPTWASPYGLAYMGPIWVQYGLAQMGLPRYSPYGTHIGLLAGMTDAGVSPSTYLTLVLFVRRA